MVLNFRLPGTGEEEALLTAAGNRKQQADERKSAKNGSKNAATDGGKTNVPEEVKKPKAAAKPMEKLVQPTDSAKSATSQTPPLAPAVNQPSLKREVSWDDDKQLPGKSPRLQLCSKGEDDDDRIKKLLNNLDWGQGKLEPMSPEDTGKLVLKMRLHCEGCNRNVRRAVKNYEGVEAVALDADSDLVTVTGIINREKLVSYLKQKLKQEIEVVLPAGPDNDGEAVPVMGRQDIRWQKLEVASADDGRRKIEEDARIAASQKMGQLRELDLDMLKIGSTLILRISLHCDGCIKKIRDAIKQFKGVESVKFRRNSDLVAVVGDVDMRELVPYLENKLRCKVEVVPGRKSSSSVDEKHRGKSQPACGKKVSKEVHPDPVAGHAGRQSPTERGTPATLPPTNEKDANEKGDSSGGTGNELPTPVGWSDGMPCASYNGLHQNRIVDMFSDENPNACSIM